MLFVLIATLFCTIIPYLSTNVNPFFHHPELRCRHEHLALLCKKRLHRALFNRQTIKLRTAAKLTQAQYGKKRAPATHETIQKLAVVAMTDIHNRTNSTKAHPGRCKPKNTADQPAFKASWTANSAMGKCRPWAGDRSHASHPATAIKA